MKPWDGEAFIAGGCLTRESVLQRCCMKFNKIQLDCFNDKIIEVFSVTSNSRLNYSW